MSDYLHQIEEYFEQEQAAEVFNQAVAEFFAPQSSTERGLDA